MLQYTGTYTDLYQLTMAQVYFQNNGADQEAVFDYFFRKLPFEGGYAIFAGLEDLLDALEKLHFNEADIAFLKKQNFDPKFLDYLKDFRFKGNIISSAEGDLVFPTRPVLRVQGNIIEAQLIETLLLNILNFQTLIATKARRMRSVAGDKMLVDFGMRRAQGSGAYHASRAAIIGGFDATSNVTAARDYNIAVSGTMAHSFIQSYDREISSFRAYAASWPDDSVLLVDTYDTLKSGVPNAIEVAKELKERGQQLKGIRLDSGDLAYLAKKSRAMLDKAGLEDVKIVASNQLDEYVIKSLLEQQAPIDVFGVGTSLLTGQPDAALDGVYKLAYTKGKPRLKLSENTEKTTLPGKKQVHRMLDNNGDFLGADIVTLDYEENLDKMHHPFQKDKFYEFSEGKSEALLSEVMKEGKRVNKPKSLTDIRKYSKTRLGKLAEEYQRFENSHIYKIGLSTKLHTERNKLIEKLTKKK